MAAGQRPGVILWVSCGWTCVVLALAARQHGNGGGNLPPGPSTQETAMVPVPSFGHLDIELPSQAVRSKDP